MTRYKTITEYRVLPPRVRIIYPEVSDPGQRCIADSDKLLRPRGAGSSSYGATDDIAALVFSAQQTERDASSRSLSRLITERMALADRHTERIRDRIRDLGYRIPRLTYTNLSDGSLPDVERQVLELEKQEREVQSKLWSDIVDLRKELHVERSEYQGARRRFSFFAEAVDDTVQ